MYPEYKKLLEEKKLIDSNDLHAPRDFWLETVI